MTRQSINLISTSALGTFECEWVFTSWRALTVRSSLMSWCVKIGLPQMLCLGSLIPRPLPDFISQLTVEKIWEWPGIKANTWVSHKISKWDKSSIMIPWSCCLDNPPCMIIAQIIRTSCTVPDLAREAMAEKQTLAVLELPGQAICVAKHRYVTAEFL